MAAGHGPALPVVPVIEGAVLADHPVDGPHAGEVVAPARGSAGHRHHADARVVQRPEGRVGCGREQAVAGQRVVDVREEERKAPAEVRGQLLDRPRGRRAHPRGLRPGVQVRQRRHHPVGDRLLRVVVVVGPGAEGLLAELRAAYHGAHRVADHVLDRVVLVHAAVGVRQQGVAVDGHEHHVRVVLDVGVDLLQPPTRARVPGPVPGSRREDEHQAAFPAQCHERLERRDVDPGAPDLRLAASALVLDALDRAGRVDDHPGEDLREREHEAALLVQLHPGHRDDRVRDLLPLGAVPLQQLEEVREVEIAVVLHQDQAELLPQGQGVQLEEVLQAIDAASGQHEVADDAPHQRLVGGVPLLVDVLVRHHGRSLRVTDHLVDDLLVDAPVQLDVLAHGCPQIVTEGADGCQSSSFFLGMALRRFA